MPGRHHGAHGAHGAHGGALRPMTGQRSLPVLDPAEAGALRRMRSLPQLVVGGKGQNLPRLAWHPDGSPKKNGYGMNMDREKGMMGGCSNINYTMI